MPAIAWAIMTLFLIGTPGKYFPEVKTFWEWLSPDKIIHVFIFSVQTYLVLFAVRLQYLSGTNRFFNMLVILGIIFVFAALTEILQKYVFFGRDGNVLDFIADVVGIAVGLLAYNLLVKKKETYSKTD